MDRPLSIYIHIPFCVKKCGYCDFLSFPCGEEERKRYVGALKREIAGSPCRDGGYEIQTVFIGGGTPSVLDGAQLEGILCQLKEVFPKTAEDPECTVEVNPGSVTREKLDRYRRAGLNRLSIGLQSVHGEELKRLGRAHSFRDFERTFEEAREAGFENINVDLMYALPGQTRRSFRESLERVLTFEPEHISAYGLILEEGTRFYELYAGQDRERSRARGEGTGGRLEGNGAGMRGLPGEEEEIAMYELAGRLLEESGYERYEISNYAMPGFLCRHNRVYWERGEYLGFGLGASSLMEGARFQNRTRLSDYCENPLEREEFHRLTGEEAMEEFMFLGLRMRRGIEEERFLREFGKPFWEVYGGPAGKLIREGLAERRDGTFFLTEKGNLLSNYALAEFLF